MDVLKKTNKFIEDRKGSSPDSFSVSSYRKYTINSNLHKSNIIINPTNDLYDMYTSFFKSVRREFRLAGDTEVEYYYFRSNPAERENATYSNLEADFFVAAGIKADFSFADRRSILDVTLQRLHETCPAIDKEDIVSVNFLYSDREPISLTSIRGTVATEYPHLFYSNVNSLAEYKERTSDTRKINEGVYEVDFVLFNDSYDEMENDESLRVWCEDKLHSLVSHTFMTNRNNYKIEGEVIAVDGNDYLTIDDDYAMYYVFIPVSNGHLFNTK